ncbi:MAG: GTPase Era [Kiritimatiellaeota bacterium]|nr:GTPase Era [Kiritimatiellota bacterium]
MSHFRAATVCVAGRTNAGKSTLVNRLVGEKISIVSPVVQTTRSVIRGFYADARGQLLLLDTPGMHQARSTLGTLMNRAARNVAGGADITLLLADASRAPQPEDEGWLNRLRKLESPFVVALNKCDDARFNPAPFADAWQRLGGGTPFAPLHISAGTGAGVEALLEKLFSLAPETDAPLFDPELPTDHPRKLAIADILREKLFAKLHDELPHEVAVMVDSIDEHAPDDWVVNATVLVNRFSQKGMVIGEKGRTLRYVKRQAQPEITENFSLAACELNLWVKVEKNWMKNFFLLRQLGYA